MLSLCVHLDFDAQMFYPSLPYSDFDSQPCCLSLPYSDFDSQPCCLSLPYSDFDSLDERDQQKNNQLGFDVAEREFGISPCMTGKEMSQVSEPDKLSMVMYLSQFYEMFKDTVPPGAGGE
jgi:hypothetical protein